MHRSPPTPDVDIPRQRDRSAAPIEDQGLGPASLPPGAGDSVDRTDTGNPWRRAVRSALGVWFAAGSAHVLVSLYIWIVSQKGNHPLRDIVGAGHVWDAVHYLRIAAKGYEGRDDSPAFFPLYPYTVRYVDKILPEGQLVAALTVSAICALGALILMHRLAEYEFGSAVAGRATLYLAAFPASFFLFVAYNESMFIMLAIGTLYFVRRGNWWLAGALGGLACLSRMFGILLVLPMAWEYLRQCGWRWREIRTDVLAIGLIPAGLGVYAAYLWLTYGDPLKFSSAQNAWQRKYVFPGQALWDSLMSIVHNTQPFLNRPNLGSVMELASLTLAIVLLVLALVGPWKFRRDQAYLVVYGGVGLLLLSSMELGGGGSVLQSAPRLILETVPIFLVLARIGARQNVDRFVLVVGFSLQAVLMLLYLNGIFVA